MSRITRAQSTSTNPSLAHCLAEMERTHRLVMRTFSGTDHARKCLALGKACEAYRAAMPTLDSPENVQDFIVCFTHGMLIEVFYEWEAAVYLSAARAALASFKALPKPEKPTGTPENILEKRQENSQQAA